MKNKITIKPFDKLPKEGSLSNIIHQLVLYTDKGDLSTHARKFILCLSLNLHEYQLKRNKLAFVQLDLFDNTTNYNGENKDMFFFEFNYSDFLPKGSKNTKQIKDAIDELQLFFHTIYFEKTDKTGKVLKYKFTSPLISSNFQEENTKFEISINAFWYRALINLTDGYNVFLKSIVYNLNDSPLNMYLYLLTLQKLSPTIADKNHFDKLNSFSYAISELKGTKKDSQDLLKDVLKLTNPQLQQKKRYSMLLDTIRQELNKKADISFNYKIVGENTYILAYPVNSVKLEQDIEKIDVQKIKNALRYKAKSLNLDYTQTAFLAELYMRYTYEIVLKATNKKKELKKLTGEAYINTFKYLLDKYLFDNGLTLELVAYKDAYYIRKEIIPFLKKNQ